MSYPPCEDVSRMTLNLRFTIYDLRVRNDGCGSVGLPGKSAVVADLSATAGSYGATISESDEGGSGAAQNLWCGGASVGQSALNLTERLISRIIPPFPAYSRVLKGIFFCFSGKAPLANFRGPKSWRRGRGRRADNRSLVPANDHAHGNRSLALASDRFRSLGERRPMSHRWTSWRWNCKDLRRGIRINPPLSVYVRIILRGRKKGSISNDQAPKESELGRDGNTRVCSARRDATVARQPRKLSGPPPHSLISLQNGRKMS